MSSEDTPEGTGGIVREKVTVVPDLQAIRTTIQQLPQGHMATLAILTRALHLNSILPERSVPARHIADFLSTAFCT